MQPREPPRRIAIWDPSSVSSDRFIVGHGSSVSLYQWLPKKAEIRTLSTHSTQTLHDPSVLKCLTWSPHTTHNDLVATGSATGRVHLLRLNAGISSAPDAYNSLPTPTVVNLPLRVTRPCNALAFSSHDPNYLAIGVDKSRGEPGLMVWDIETAAATLPASRMYPDNPTPPPRPQPKLPIRPLAPNETRSDPRILYQHGAAEAVHSVTFLPHTSSQLLVGVAMKWIRLIDLRMSPNTGIQQILNKCSYGLCNDPFDETKFACYGDDGAIRVWDRRYFQNNPFLAFSEADAGSDGGRPGALSSISFSPTRRGILAALGNDDTTVRLWTIIGGHVVGENDNEPTVDRSTHKRTVSISRNQPVAKVVDRPLEKGDYFMPTLVHTRRTRRFNRPLASFCFATNPPAPHKTTHLLTVTKEGAVDIAPVYDSPHHKWSSKGDLTVCSYEDLRIRKSMPQLKEPIEPWDVNLDYSVGGKSPAAAVKSPSQANIHSPPGEARMGRSPSVQRRLDAEFPPLPPPSSSLSATRPKSSRTYSPSAMLRFPLGSRRSYTGTPQSDSRNSAGASPKSSPRVKGKGLPGSSTASPKASPRTRAKKLPPTEGNATRGKKDKARGAAIEHRGANVMFEDEVDASPLSAAETNLIEDKRGRKYMVEDISNVMRSRVLKGYGMENGLHNAAVALDEPVSGPALSSVWRTLSRFMDMTRTGQSNRVLGYDFAYQGLLGIWEGFAATAPANGPGSERHTKIHSNSIPESPSLTSSNLALSQISSGAGSGTKRHSVISHSTESSMTYASATSNRTAVSGGSLPDYDEAVDILNERRSIRGRVGGGMIGGLTGYPPITFKTARAGRRRLALALCQWDLSTEEFALEIKKWEAEDHTSRAACWSVLLKEYDQAIEYLMRSREESHRILSGTVSAIINQGSPESGRPSPWRDHCERLIVGLDDPYLRILLSALIEQPWSEILQDEAIPLHDRLGIILRFLDDDKVSYTLRKTFEMLKSSGDLEGLLFTGLTPLGMDVIQVYVDRTSDVQTAAILASYVSPGRFKDARVERWVDAYHELLDNWGLFHHRCQFDIERGQMLQHMIQAGEIQSFEWVERQLLIRCNYCNKVINSQQSMTESLLPGPVPMLSNERVQTNCCPSCRKTLPRCVICLMTVGVAHDAARNTELTYETSLKDTIDDGMVFCQTCRHGGHASHIFDWFFGGNEPHKVCPVADCNCRCAEL